MAQHGDRLDIARSCLPSGSRSRPMPVAALPTVAKPIHVPAMKVEALRSLCAVIEHGSIAAAAPTVNLTASAIGLQLRQLEEHFGRLLFDRSARQVRPTAFGLEVANAVRGTLDTLDALREHGDASVSGRLRLGVIESAQIALLPAYLRELRALYPRVEVQISRGVSQALLQDIQAGRLDAAVVVRPRTGGSTRLHWVPLRREPFVIVAPPGLRAQSPADILRRHEWIRLDRSATGGRIAAAYVERIAPGKRPWVDLPGTDAIVAMVSAGLGVSVIPATRAALKRAYDFKEIDLGASAPVREIALACRGRDAENRRFLAARHAFEQAARGVG